MTPIRILRLVLATVAPAWAVQGCGTPEHEKPVEPVEPVLDYSKPVYTVDHAIVCPLGTLIAAYVDARADHGPGAIVALYISPVGREIREKALGCEEWPGGVKRQRTGNRTLLSVYFSRPIVFLLEQRVSVSPSSQKLRMLHTHKSWTSHLQQSA
jgi:hypothetical protein